MSRASAFVVSLATYRYCWVRSGVGDDALPHRLAGTVGHSQGLAAAMAVSLASDIDSFLAYSWEFARLLLHLGILIAESLHESAGASDSADG